MSGPNYRLILVDDHTLFRSGLRGLLEMDRRFTVLAEYADGESFLDNIPKAPETIILLDIDMPGKGGYLTAVEALAADPELKIITLSMHGEEQYYFNMVGAGVKGFLLKDSEIEHVRTAIETVAEGGSYFSQELLTSLVNNLRKSPASAGENSVLSGRELEILVLICKGLSNQEIAEELFISKRTVDKHRANILVKTNCRNTANLVVYAIKNSLVEI